MSTPSSTPHPGAPHLGAMVRALWQKMRDLAYAQVAEVGYDDLQPAHLQVFRTPGPAGAHPSELAARMQISKQSVNDLLGHLEQRGYLTREPDPADGRGRVVTLTEKGRGLEQAVERAAQDVEARIGELLGPERFGDLRATLQALTADDALG